MMILLKEQIEKKKRKNLKETKSQEKYPELKHTALIQDGLCNLPQSEQPRPIPRNSVESDTDVQR